MSSEANGKGNGQEIDEAPVDEIREAAGNYPTCLIRISRGSTGVGRPGKAQIICSKQLKQTIELADLSDWLRDTFGGGRYRVEAFLPDDMTTPIIRPFWIHVDGPKLSARTSQQQQQGSPYPQWAYGPPVLAPPMSTQGVPPPYVSPQGQSQYQQDSSLNPQNRLDRPMTRYTPDELAVNQAHALSAELYRERELRERERREFTTKLEALEKSFHNERERLRDEQRKTEHAAFEKRIELMSQVQNRPNTNYAELIAAMAPVMSTYLVSSKDREAIAAERMNRSAEMQMASMNKILEAGLASKNDGSLDKMMAVFMPMVQETIKSKPAMLEAMSEHQLASWHMVQEFLNKQFEGEKEKPAWYPIVENLLSGIMSIGEAYVGSKDQPIAHAPQVQVMPKQMTGVPNPQVMSSQDQPQEQLPTPEVLVNMIMQSNQVPPEFKTPEWRALLLMIHSQHDVAQVTDTLLDHLEHLEKFNILPNLLQNYGESPREVFSRLLNSLPVSKTAPTYVEELLTLLEKAFEKEGDTSTSTASSMKPNMEQTIVS